MSKRGLYLPKQLLFVALMLFSSASFSIDAPAREIQLGQEDVAYVFIGDEASSMLATMKDILCLAEGHDGAPHMRAILERAEQGYKTARKEEVLTALHHEAYDILEKNHRKIEHDAQLKGLMADLAKACKLVDGDALTIMSSSADDDAEDAARGCGSSKKFCNLTVTGVASAGTLFVSGNETVGGNLRVNGGLSVTGATSLTSLFINGVLINPAVITNAFVQGGNSFGAPAFLGTNDVQPLNIETADTDRIQIAATGTVNIVAPDALAGTALTVNANATSSALSVIGDAGATAAIITPGLNQIGLSIGDSGTAAGLSVSDSAIVQAGAGGNVQPLFAGGTQTVGSALVTTVRGAPRMIWAQIPAIGLTATAQSGGISAVVNTGAGLYTITYDAFTTPPAIIGTVLASGHYIAATAITGTTVNLEVRTDAGVPTSQPFSILIIGTDL